MFLIIWWNILKINFRSGELEVVLGLWVEQAWNWKRNSKSYAWNIHRPKDNLSLEQSLWKRLRESRQKNGKWGCWVRSWKVNSRLWGKSDDCSSCSMRSPNLNLNLWCLIKAQRRNGMLWDMANWEIKTKRYSEAGLSNKENWRPLRDQLSGTI